MSRLALSVLLSACVLAGCGDTPPKAGAGSAKPLRTACTTPDQAGQKALDIVARLAEARQKGTITQDQYAAFNNTMSEGFRVWAERQDLRAYCAVLQRVASDAALN